MNQEFKEYLETSGISEEKVKSYIAHYGIKGMRWGVRRTEEQLARARGTRTSSEDQNGIREQVKRSSSARTVYKYRSLLSDSELRERLNRINMETQLKNLSDAEKKKGNNIAKTILDYGKTANEFYSLYKSPAAQAAISVIRNRRRSS